MPRKTLEGQYTDGELNILNRANMAITFPQYPRIPVRIRDWTPKEEMTPEERKRLKNLQTIASENNAYEGKEIDLRKGNNGIFFTYIEVSRQQEGEELPQTTKYAVFQVTRVDQNQTAFPNLLTLEQLLQLYHQLAKENQYKCDELLIPIVSKSSFTSSSHIRLLHVKYDKPNHAIATVYESKGESNEYLNSTEPTRQIAEATIMNEFLKSFHGDWAIPGEVETKTEYISSGIYQDIASFMVPGVLQGQPVYNDTDCGVFVFKMIDQFLRYGEIRKAEFDEHFGERQRGRNRKLYKQYTKEKLGWEVSDLADVLTGQVETSEEWVPIDDEVSDDEEPINAGQPSNNNPGHPPTDDKEVTGHPPTVDKEITGHSALSEDTNNYSGHPSIEADDAGHPPTDDKEITGHPALSEDTNNYSGHPSIEEIKSDIGQIVSEQVPDIESQLPVQDDALIDFLPHLKDEITQIIAGHPGEEVIKDIFQSLSDQAQEEKEELLKILVDIRKKVTEGNLFRTDEHRLKRCIHFCSLVEIMLGNTMGALQKYKEDAFRQYRDNPPTKFTPYARAVAKLEPNVFFEYRNDSQVRSELKTIQDEKAKLEKTTKYK